MLCAAIAGSIARVICHPLETIKTVAFTGFAGEYQSPPIGQASYPGGVSSRFAFPRAAKEIWLRDGIAGFYRGVGISAFGAAPAMALYLTSYDYFRAGWRALAADAEENAALIHTEGSVMLSIWQWGMLPIFVHTPAAVASLTCGFLAEAASCVVWVPMDVSKERLQSQPSSLRGRYQNSWDALRTIVRYEGLRGLYRGYYSTLGSFGPFSAVYFLSYEIFTSLLSRFCVNNNASLDLGNDPDNTEQGTRVLVALGAGAGGNIMASLTTNPLEFVKTRLQVQRAILKGNNSRLFKYQYRGLCDGLLTVIKEEGVWGLWRGVGCRIAHAAPNAALTMALYEYLKNRARET